jgi:cyclase
MPIHRWVSVDYFSPPTPRVRRFRSPGSRPAMKRKIVPLACGSRDLYSALGYDSHTMRSELALLLIVASAACGRDATVDTSAEPAKRPPGMAYKPPAFTFHEIRDGIYHAVGTDSLVVVSNAAIIVGDHDVLVVDSHASPAAAWALREELSAITPKPIRYVVNTHHHWDHVHGNQIYGPDVEIIGHELTRAAIVAGESTGSIGYKLWVGGLPDRIRELERKLAAATNEGEREEIAAELEIDRNFLDGTRAVEPTPPTMTFTQTLTLHRGSREIRIMYLGRGHTDSDVIVYLPAERVVVTGDLLVENTAYLGDAFFVEWVETLEQLKTLDFDIALPGHGRAFGKSKIDHWQAYLRDFWAQAQAFHHAKISAVEAAKQVDLRAHGVNYPSITAVGIDPDHGMLRAYELLDAVDQ